MADRKRCPRCGTEVPEDAPEGLCPNCVLRAGLKSDGGSLGDTSTTPDSATDSFRPPPPSELAEHFPDLEILEFIGRGGMGLVYKARQRRLDRLVALKILPPKIARDAAFAERFAREARAMAMLSHPNIVAVYDFGQTSLPMANRNGTGEHAGQRGASKPDLPALYYFLMEYVDGPTLDAVMESGKLASAEALAIVPQICEALQYAHDNGVVHRDIKPGNILLDRRGRLKIADFGLAKLVGRPAEDATLTGIGQVMGTPHYMAPEQWEHPQEVDHRADIYSLGVVFYQMLTGELPLGRFAPPSKKVAVDVRLDEVVLRALEKEPQRRYQQASQVKSEVETIVATPPRPAGSVGDSEIQPPPAGVRPSSDRRFIRAGRCRMTTPERLGTMNEQLFLWSHSGHLTLDDQQLSFVEGRASTEIPLAAIRQVGIGRFPRVMNPAGLDCIHLDYELDGTARQQILAPFESLFGRPSYYNGVVAKWFTAIRDAATHAQGSPPSPPPPEQLRIRSSPGLLAMAVIGLLLAVTPLCMVLWNRPTSAARDDFIGPSVRPGVEAVAPAANPTTVATASTPAWDAAERQARDRFRLAEEEFARVDTRYKAGFKSTKIDQLRAQCDRDVAAAELKAASARPPQDPALEVAQAKFHAADETLRLRETQFRAGAIDSDVMAEAKRWRQTAAEELSRLATRPISKEAAAAWEKGQTLREMLKFVIAAEQAGGTPFPQSGMEELARQMRENEKQTNVLLAGTPAEVALAELNRRAEEWGAATNGPDRSAADRLRKQVETGAQQLDRMIVGPESPPPIPARTLEFHIAPNRPGTKRPPEWPKFTPDGKEDFGAAAKKELAANGPAKARPGDEQFQWYELREKGNFPDLLTAEYQNKKYVLLCARPPFAMLPNSEGPDAWGLKSVTVERNTGGFPQIRVHFTRRGGTLFSALTGANLGNILAIVVDGRVVTLPRLQSRIGEKAAISGNFNQQEIDQLVAKIKGSPTGVKSSADAKKLPAPPRSLPPEKEVPGPLPTTPKSTEVP